MKCLNLTFTNNQRATNKSTEILCFFSHIKKVNNKQHWQEDKETGMSNFIIYVFFDLAMRYLS